MAFLNVYDIGVTTFGIDPKKWLLRIFRAWSGGIQKALA